MAADYMILGPDGKELPKSQGAKESNYHNAASFGMYEKFAQVAKKVQHDKYPELDSKFAWGGYYGGGRAGPYGYGSMDEMHFDIGGARGSMGNWEKGASPELRKLYPGLESQGMGPLDKYKLPERQKPPVPVSQAAPTGNVQMPNTEGLKDNEGSSGRPTAQNLANKERAQRDWDNAKGGHEGLDYNNPKPDKGVEKEVDSGKKKFEKKEEAPKKESPTHTIEAKNDTSKGTKEMEHHNTEASPLLRISDSMLA
jgi:hypothetical protein